MDNKANIKFMDVDLLATMAYIVEAHTQYYKADFYVDDMKCLQKAVTEELPKTFLWLCRTHGTWLLNERNAFIRKTFEHNTFTFYAENHINGILAYVVEVIYYEDSKPFGNLYTLDYEQYASHITKVSLKPFKLVLNYQKGTRYVCGDTLFTSQPDNKLGTLMSYEYLPESQVDLDYLLHLEKKNRERFITGSLSFYLEGLESSVTT